MTVKNGDPNETSGKAQPADPDQSEQLLTPDELNQAAGGIAPRFHRPPDYDFIKYWEKK